jgi:protein-disulfide isomerase
MQVVKENKLKCLFLLLSLALLIAVIALVPRGGGSASKRHLVLPQEPGASARAYALLVGIPQHGSVLGYPKAPVTLQFFGDLQCKESRQVMLGPLPFLIRRFVKTGKLKIRFRSTETDTKNWLEFRNQQAAALAAGRQGRLWNFIDVFYREQQPEFSEYADEAFLERIGREAALDLKRWEGDREPPEDWEPRLEADEELGKAAGMISTPSFLIGPTGGVAHPLRHFGLQEPEVFEEAVSELL